VTDIVDVGEVHVQHATQITKLRTERDEGASSVGHDNVREVHSVVRWRDPAGRIVVLIAYMLFRKKHRFRLRWEHRILEPFTHMHFETSLVEMRVVLRNILIQILPTDL
jgi:hypothetical protein